VVTAKPGEWWEGYLESDPAKSGQFPSNYVDPAPADAVGAAATPPVPAATTVPPTAGAAQALADVSIV